MAAAPYMPLYVGDYLADTTHLTTEEHGAYLLLLMSMWRAGGRLPRDDRKLARIVGVPDEKWSDMRVIVLEFFTVRGGWIIHDRLRRELDKYVSIIDRAKRGGKATAEKKANKNKRNSADQLGAKSPPKVNQPEPELEPKERTPQTPLGGEREFTEALNAYPEAGRVSTTPDKAKSAWDVACRTETPERLLQAVRAFAASTTAQADRANRVPSFQRWLTDKRFAVLLTGSATPTWAGPPEIRAAIAQALGEPFARSYIDPAGWQDVPIRGLVPRNATSAGRIADQALGILETFEASILPVETGRAA